MILTTHALFLMTAACAKLLPIQLEIGGRAKEKQNVIDNRSDEISSLLCFHCPMALEQTKSS